VKVPYDEEGAIHFVAGYASKSREGHGETLAGGRPHSIELRNHCFVAEKIVRKKLMSFYLTSSVIPHDSPRGYPDHALSANLIGEPHSQKETFGCPLVKLWNR
jgi:hypothetical protein